MNSLVIINSFTIIVFISIVNHTNSQNFIFPTAVTLYDENILVIDKFGIYICDSTFTNITLIYSLDEEEQIKTKDDLSRVVLKKTKGYIICLLNYKIYFFSGKGVLLKISNKFYEEELEYYTLIPVELQDNFLYFIIGFFDSNMRLNLTFYKYHTSYNNFYFITSKTQQYVSSYNFISNALSCEYMNDHYTENLYALTCFFIVYGGGNQYLIAEYFRITTSSIDNLKIERYSKNVENIKIIKSESNYNLNLVLICLVQENGKTFFVKFYFYNGIGEFYDPTEYKVNCKNEIYGLKVSYMYENRNVILSCICADGGIQVDIYNENLESPYATTFKKFRSCEAVFGYSILYINDYYVLSDTICNGIKNSFKQLKIQDV